MPNEENKKEEYLRKEIENYINENGFKGFFGLLASLELEKVDKEDLEKYNHPTPKTYEKSSFRVLKMEDEERITTSVNKHENEDVQRIINSGMYEQEHLNEVAEDYIEHSKENIEVMNEITKEMPEETPIEETIYEEPTQETQLVEESYVEDIQEYVEKPLIEEQKLPNNPWADLRRVTPGEEEEKKIMLK